MKNKITIIFLILVMLFSLSLPAFAFDSSDLWNDIVDMDVYNSAPEYDIWGLAGYEEVVGVGDWHVMFYDELNERYVIVCPHGVSYGASFYLYSNENILKLNKMDSDKFSVYGYNSATSKWESLKYNISLYDVTGFKLVKARNVGFSIDDKYVQYDGVKLEYDGSVVEKPEEPEHGGGGADLNGEDINNSGLLSGLTKFFEDFFNGLFEGILSVVDFVITVLKKIGDLLLSLVALIQAIPLFLEGLINLIAPEGPLVSTMKNFFGQNTYANSIFVMLLSFLGYGVFKSVKSLVKDGTDWS